MVQISNTTIRLWEKRVAPTHKHVFKVAPFECVGINGMRKVVVFSTVVDFNSVYDLVGDMIEEWWKFDWHSIYLTTKSPPAPFFMLKDTSFWKFYETMKEIKWDGKEDILTWQDHDNKVQLDMNPCSFSIACASTSESIAALSLVTPCLKYRSREVWSWAISTWLGLKIYPKGSLNFKLPNRIAAKLFGYSLIYYIIPQMKSFPTSHNQ